MKVKTNIFKKGGKVKLCQPVKVNKAEIVEECEIYYSPFVDIQYAASLMINQNGDGGITLTAGTLVGRDVLYRVGIAIPKHLVKWLKEQLDAPTS